MGRQAAVIAAVSGLVLTSAVAADAAELQPQREVAEATLAITVEHTTVVAASTTSVAFNRVPVKVDAAPVVVPEEAPVPAAVAPVAPVA